MSDQKDQSIFIICDEEGDGKEKGGKGGGYTAEK